jgi:hypothetical protein
MGVGRYCNADRRVGVLEVCDVRAVNGQARFGCVAEQPGVAIHIVAANRSPALQELSVGTGSTIIISVSERPYLSNRGVADAPLLPV